MWCDQVLVNEIHRIDQSSNQRPILRPLEKETLSRTSNLTPSQRVRDLGLQIPSLIPHYLNENARNYVGNEGA